MKTRHRTCLNKLFSGSQLSRQTFGCVVQGSRSPRLSFFLLPLVCLLTICEFNNLEAKVHMKEAEANPSAEGPPPSWTFLMIFCGIVCGEDQIFAAGRDAADENSLCAFDSALQHLSVSLSPSLSWFSLFQNPLIQSFLNLDFVSRSAGGSRAGK